MQQGSPEQAACVRRAIETGGRDDFPLVLAAIRQSGALEHTLGRAREAARQAADAISLLPDSNYKTSLLELAAFAVDRSH